MPSHPPIHYGRDFRTSTIVATSSPMTEPIRKLGRYELLRQLATGGMGEIYLARTRGAGGFEKHLIIKTILSHLAEHDEFVTKFLDEGRTVVQLTHGNIVPVFDMGEEDGEYFIAMEYVPGLDLRAIIKRLDARGEILPVELALYIGCEICKGLGYAHRKTDDDGNPLEIVHRDVSPSNVLVSKEGEVKIIDFGIARAAGNIADTASGRIQGKCCYMSPEQARGQTLDARSDIFSTGVLLYELLTHQRPFEGRTDLESLELVKKCDADPPGVLRAEIPEEVDDIICRAMAPEPKDRYPSIDEMFVELQQQLYMLGETITSQRLAEELAEVFADDEVDDEAEQNRRPPANLDEALELELAKLDDTSATSSTPSGSSLELASTAPAADAGGTRTLAPTPTERPGGRDDNDSADIDVADADVSPDNDEDADPTPTATTRRIAIGLAAGAVIAAGVVAAVTLLPPADATLELDSDPQQARIHVDGDELAGRTTPEALQLDPGRHEIELTLDGYQPRRFTVELDPGDELSLGDSDLRLEPEQQPDRHFTITADPEDATLTADGEPLGDSPAELTLSEDDVVNISATAPGCSAVYYTLSYRHESDVVELDLQCDEEPDEQTDDDDSPPLRAERERMEVRDGITDSIADNLRAVRIETDPEGAALHIDGEEAGHSPLDARLSPADEVTIEAHHDGYETYRTTVDADDIDGDQLDLQLEPRPTGCLNFRALYPANNKIAINDEWLDGRHMTLENHSLPAGENTITVHHPDSDKKESFDVDIEPGDECKVLTVWER